MPSSDPLLPYPLVIEAADAAAALQADSGCRLVDLRSGEAFEQEHAPGAVHLDASWLNRPDPPAAGLLPNRDAVERIVSHIGLTHDGHVIACDAGATTAAARLIWVLHAWGITNCSWLNGGMAAWQAGGLPIQHGPAATVAAGNAAVSVVRSHGSADNVIDADTLLGELDDTTQAIIDVRRETEYAGSEVRSAMGGHVPGACHLEWTRMLGPDRRLLPNAQLLAMLEAVGIRPDMKAIVYCPSHQRSAVTYVALKHLGFTQVRALDGAWSTWGNRADLPKETA